MSATPQSRFCAGCQTSWPAVHEFTACPYCDTPTSSDMGTEPQYDSYESAMVEAIRRKRQDAFAEFDATYDEACLLADLAMIEHATPDEWAAQFAKLNEQPEPTKEVT